MPKFPNSHFYGGKTTFGGANLRKNIRRLQTTPYSALSNVRSIEAKPVTVNGKLSSAALNGDSHLSSRTKRVLECLEKTALPVSSCKRQRLFEPYVPPPMTVTTTTKELLNLQEKDKIENATFSSSKVPFKFPIKIHEKPPAKLEIVSKFEEFKRKRLAEKSSKWTCSVCCVDNDMTDDKCSACEEPNPKKKKEQKSSEPFSNAGSPQLQTLFSFGTPQVVSTAFSNSLTLSKFTFSPPSSTTTTTTATIVTPTIKELPKSQEKTETENVIVNSNSEPSIPSSLNHEVPVKSVTVEDASKFEEFKQKRLAEKSSKWTCSVCCVDNDMTDDKCSACEEPNPKKKKEQKSSEPFSNAGSPQLQALFSFGTPQVVSTAFSNSLTFSKFTFSPPSSTTTTTTAAIVTPTVKELPKSPEKTETENVIVNSNSEPSIPSSLNHEVPVKSVTVEDASKFEEFKQKRLAEKSSKWTCSVCCVDNDMTDDKCSACEEPNPKKEKESSKTGPSKLSLAAPFGLDINFGSPITLPKIDVGPPLQINNKLNINFSQATTTTASTTGSTGFNFSQTLPTLGKPASTTSVDTDKKPPALPQIQPPLFKFGQTSTSSSSTSGSTSFNFSQTLPTLGQPTSTPSFGAATQQPTLSAQPSPFAFGQSSNNVAPVAAAAGNSGFNFGQTLPTLSKPASTPSVDIDKKPSALPSIQPTLFKFGQSSNNSVASTNTGFNFSQTLPTVGQPASTPSFGASTQPAALPSVQPSPFAFGQSSNNVAPAATTAGNFSFNFGQTAVAPVGQTTSTTSVGTDKKPSALPPIQPTLFKFGQSSTSSSSTSGSTGFNFSQTLPTLGQPTPTPSFGAATQQPTLPAQPSPFAFGQSSNNVAPVAAAAAAAGNSGFNFGQTAVAPVGQPAAAPSFGALFGASSTQLPAVAAPVIPTFGSTAAFPPVAAPQANSGFKFEASNLNFPAFSAPAPAPLDGNAGNMFAFNPSDQNTMPTNRQIKKAKRRLR